MYRIVSGSVRLSITRPDGKQLIYLFFKPGDCFGTSSVIDNAPRPQTAEVQEKAELQVISRPALNQLRNNYPEVNNALLSLISHHMRLLSNYFASACLDTLPCRVAQRIIEATQSFGNTTETGIKLSIRLPQSEIALMVGTSRQSVNKVMHQLHTLGIISVSYGSIIVHKPNSLKEIAEQDYFTLFSNP